MLDADELESMRDEMTASFPDVAQIRTPQITTDGQGTVESYGGGGAVPYTPCRKTPPHFPDDKAVGGAIRGDLDWDILFPYGTAVSMQDRIVISGDVYDVINVDDGGTEGLCVRVWARRVTEVSL